MIKLKFEIDEATLKEDLEESPVKADPSALEITYFLMPTKFLINGTDLFYYYDNGNKVPCDGLEMPLFGFSKDFLECVRTLKLEGKSRYLFLHRGGFILLTMISEDEVKIEFSNHKDIFTVNYEELLCAANDFVKNVRSFLKERVPEMLDHPDWGEWVRNNN